MARSMKVISTNPGASQPRRESWAELMNSSLAKYPSVTVCARFLTHHFSTDPNSGPAQILLYYADHVLLSSYTTRSCDQYFQVDSLRLCSIWDSRSLVTWSLSPSKCPYVFFYAFVTRVALRPTKRSWQNVGSSGSEGRCWGVHSTDTSTLNGLRVSGTVPALLSLQMLILRTRLISTVILSCRLSLGLF